MRKIILIMGIMALLVLSGCGQKPADIAKVKIGDEVAEADAVEPAMEEPTIDEEEGEAAEEAAEETVELEISQEELDKLKADIEGMEYEDLGGLSE